MYTKVKALLHMLIIFAIFFLSDSFGDTAFQISDGDIFYTETLYICMSILGVLIVTYLYSKYVLKKSLAEIYLGKPMLSLQWCIIAIVLPIAIDAFYLLFINGEFQWGNYSQTKTAYILFITIFSQGLRISVTEEILFRGLALSYLQKTFSKKTGVLLANIIYISVNLVYIDTYNWRKIILLILAIFIQGTAYALITCTTGSIWASVTVHAMYNIFSGDSNILHIGPMQTYFVVCTYKLESKNWFVTGIPEWNCIDTAIPAVIGHLILIILAVLYAKKNNINLL